MAITWEDFVDLIRDTHPYGRSELHEIRWKGRKYLFVGRRDSPDTDGAITTRHRFVNGIVSIAHLHSDGKICQFHEVIGSAEDIKFVRKLKRKDVWA